MRHHTPSGQASATLPTTAAASPSAPSTINPVLRTRVTQLDVARAAGVHNTTVSLALRNSPAIPVATRERIQSLAAKLGYRPDPALRALVAYRNGLSASRHSEAIAYVTSAPLRCGAQDDPVEQRCFASAQRKTAECGYQLDHFWLGEPGMTARRLGDVLFNRGITGVLLAGAWPEAVDPAEFGWERFTAVKLGYSFCPPALHRVALDPIGNVRQAVEHLLAAGYRRPGLILPQPWNNALEHACSVGFLVQQSRLPVEQRVPILFQQSPGAAAKDSASTHDALTDGANLPRWLDEYRPDALVGSFRFIAELLSTVGLTIPGPLGFVDPFLDTAETAIAGIRQNHERVGEIAVEILIGHLQQNLRGLPAYPTTTLVDGTWQDGESLARIPTRPWEAPARGLAQRCRPAKTAA